MNVCMHDVGNGLNLFVNHKMMIDFGGDIDKISNYHYHRCCRCYPVHHIETFVLSHFHEDHYNGLFFLNHSLFNLKQVYYPGIPTIIDKNGKNIGITFFSYLMAMNHYITLGTSSGSAAADLIEQLRQVSTTAFQYAPLFKGDTFNHNGTKYEVLWPPRIINIKSHTNGKTLDSEDKVIITKIKKAIGAFEKAKVEHPELDELAEKYSKAITEKYKHENPTHEEKYNYPNANMNSTDIKLDKEPFTNEPTGVSELPPLVKTANDALRTAANDLSLAFKSENNKILFLGDLETNQINRVCQSLSRKQFDVFITPHHGTHKGGGMKLLSIKIALSSVGSLYKGYVKNPDLKHITNKLDTYNDGCIHAYIHHSSIDIERCKYSSKTI
ncbi:MAG: hypothetical protein JU82_08535 [Sulfuricurvum sp. MLSB]|uniref:hypothetical protein n=1 Tax=unclassified Sulfuricurvum TaxID=2632390 RepID=UPI0004FFF847|nr:MULTISPECIES: hypothetical protein [unclassified Sulfuricurvum]KFN39073.1 MAG: hypothetical protein JU82_08535 [Sulfuricurvum sp. MLSB]